MRISTRWGGAGLFVPAQTPTIGGGFDDATDLVAQPIGFNTRQDPDAWQDRTGPVDTHYGTQGVAQPVPMHDPNPTLDASYYKGTGERSGVERNVVATYNVSPAINTVSQRFNHGHDTTAYVMQPVARTYSTPAIGHIVQDDVASTITKNTGAGGETQNPAFVAQPVAPALTASNDPSRSPQSSEVTQQVGAVYQAAMQVRRLTPTECERLQGFPDGWTNIPWRGKPESPDGVRYKSLGNSMAVPCMSWIGKRIAAVAEVL